MIKHHHPHSALQGLSPVVYMKQAVNSGKVLERHTTLNFTTINNSNNNEK
ncbi:MAG: hypothetical protein RIG62_18100 [Cyclobacteriaceae bacterium]